MNIKKFSISFAIIILFFLVGFILIKNPTFEKDSQVIKIGGQTIKVDLAITPQAQEQGLSGRNSLKDDEGMLFVFDHPDIYPFWMKDMKFSIDILWLDENLKIVYIKKNADLNSYPEVFKPEENAKYVLEVVAGFSEKHGLKVGEQAELVY